MRHTIIIALLLITLFPNTALAQWGFDAVSVEAYINDHKKQRSLLLARSTLEYSNQLLHEYSSEEVGKYKELNVDLDKYTRAFDIIDVMYQSLRTVLNVKSTYQTVTASVTTRTCWRTSMIRSSSGNTSNWLTRCSSASTRKPSTTYTTKEANSTIASTTSCCMPQERQPVQLPTC